MTLPFPENPQHVDNLNSIDKLEAQGFEGPDVSLEISLKDYGMIWRELENGEFIFVHRLSYNARNWDRTTMAPVDIDKEFNWIRSTNWSAMLNCMGIDRQTFNEFSFEYQIYHLASYFGVEEIFGAGYWEGFKIKGI